MMPLKEMEPLLERLMEFDGWRRQGAVVERAEAGPDRERRPRQEA